ncbi:bone marrow stromal antigen 2 isoform X2 [Panthera uncia]|uniref:bone marrow stromal antigen 2 isoform X2 n=1 Tax=Panthera uncia TaxID=29064 RepID=UPI0020FFD01A|nr:bone marrow stromal antigen 2 isoform X2 [Panthera uncia]
MSESCVAEVAGGLPDPGGAGSVRGPDHLCCQGQQQSLQGWPPSRGGVSRCHPPPGDPADPSPGRLTEDRGPGRHLQRDCGEIEELKHKLQNASAEVERLRKGTETSSKKKEIASASSSEALSPLVVSVHLLLAFVALLA